MRVKTSGSLDVEGRLRAVEHALSFSEQVLAFPVTPDGAQTLDADLTQIAAIANVRGDLLVTNSGPTWVALAIGSANRVLRSDGTDPSWAQVVLTTDVSGILPIANGGTSGGTAVAGFNALSPLTTRGDLLTRDASNNVRLAVGTANQVLKTNGTDAAWAKLVAANCGSVTGSTDQFVFGTSPTFTTDITTPIAYGGAVAASTLDLRPSSAANYTGAVNVGKGAGDYGGGAVLLELWPDGMTFGFGTQIAAVHLQSTLTQGANPAAGFPVIQLFCDQHTHAPKDTTITDFASSISFLAQPTFKATTATNIASGLGRGVQWVPTVTKTSTGTIALSELTGLYDLPTVNTGATVTNRYGMQFSDFTGSGTVTTQTAVRIESLTAAGTNLAIVSAGTATQTRHAGPVAIGTNTGPNTTNGNVMELVRTHTLAAGISDGQSAGLVLSPTYSGAFTATRHSYIKATQVALAASAAVTDAAVYWFDAAVGTHKALASPGAVLVTIGTGPTGSTAGNPLGWMKINVNGTLRYVPFW